MVQVFEDCSKGKYIRTVVTSSNKGVKDKTKIRLNFDQNGRPIIQGRILESRDGTISLEDVKPDTYTYLSPASLMTFDLRCRS